MTDLREIVEEAGGASQVALLCGISPRAIYKWFKFNALPRTEYTGETHYAEKIAAATQGRFTAEQVRSSGRPSKPHAA